MLAKLKVACVTSLLLLIALLPGCTESVRCQFSNNSGDEILVVRKVGSNLEKTVFKQGQAGELRGWTSANLYVVKRGVGLKYLPVPPPEAFIERSGFGPMSERVIHARMEHDEKIYIEFGDVRSIADQPSGFPLVGAVVSPDSIPK